MNVGVFDIGVSGAQPWTLKEWVVVEDPEQLIQELICGAPCEKKFFDVR